MAKTEQPGGRTPMGMRLEEGLREALAYRRGEIALDSHILLAMPADPPAVGEQ